MSIKTQMALAQTRIGRITLHTLAIFRDHKFTRHLSGIKREIMLTSLKANGRVAA